MVWYIRRLVQLAVVLVALVQVAGLLQTVHPLFDSIAHFRLHITIILALGIGLLLLLRSWRVAGLAMTVAAAGVYGMGPALGSIGPDDGADSQRLVLVQYNMLYRNRSPAKVAEQVRAAKADAVTLQEVSDHNKALLTNLKADYPYQLFCESFSVGGVAVASRWPILAQGCGDGQGLAWIRIDVKGTPVTVASLHLHWPYPFAQSDQITSLQGPMKAMPQPVVLAGDFNAAPWSHSVERVAEATRSHVIGGIRLSLKMAPFGLGPWPLLPIDHVLVPGNARVSGMQVGSDAGSDHLPVIATINLSR